MSPGSNPIRVLVVCTGNSARSIMAEALLRSKGGDDFEVHSAGTHPRGINPLTLRVLAESGIDASWARSKSVEEYLGQSFDYVITVCDDADKNCPNFSGKVGKRVHIGFIDPAAATGSEEHIMSVFRQVRDEIRQKFSEYYQNEIRKGL